MEVLLEVTVLFALMLTVAFLIERFIEVVKSAFDLLDSRLDWCHFWTTRAQTIASNLEKRLKQYKFLGPKNMASVINRFHEMLLNDKAEYNGKVPVVAGDLVRKVYFKIFSKVLGMLIGVGLAFWLNLDLLTIWHNAAGQYSQWVIQIASPTMRIILSGMLIGLGASPMHKIIRTIERQREKRDKKEAANATAS